jgi:hypothetical protein
MKPILILYSLLFFITNSLCQAAYDSVYPDGIYHTMSSFENRQPDTSQRIRKLNCDLPTQYAFKDTLVDHCWFIDRDNDPVKKVFAIVHQGELYFPEYAIKQGMADLYSTLGMSKAHEFHRVQEHGEYLYLEVTYIEQDPGAAIVMGAMFGLVGAAAGSAMAPKSLVETPVVYHTGRKKFYGLHSRRHLKMFMEAFHPEVGFDAGRSDLDIDFVRHMIRNLNH